MNRNMSECGSVETLLSEECPQRKKRSYNSVAIKELREEQAASFYGKRMERNIAKKPLPEVGSLIKMQEVLQFVRVHTWDNPSTQGYILVPYPQRPRAATSMAGLLPGAEEMVYEVTGYTGDISNPFKSNLQMKYRNVYPASNNMRERSVPTRLIASGHIRYETINPAELMQAASHAEKDVDEN